MSEKRADKLRYWVTHLLKDLKVGDTFRPNVLHLTFVPWFVTDMEDEQVVKSFYENFAEDKAFDVIVGEEGEFKHKRRIKVNFIKPVPEILGLHAKALEWLESLEARWAVKNPHVGDDYIPHIRRREDTPNVDEGKVLHISSLYLVRAHRRGDDVRTVDAKVELK